MATLLDTLRGDRQQTGIQPAAPDSTNRLRDILRGRSGKAVVGGGTALASNLAEKQATVQAQTSAIPLQQQTALADSAARQQSAAIQQDTAISRSRMEQARRAEGIANSLRTSELLGQLERDRATLDAQKDAAKLEQVAFGLALKDKNYIETLQNVGAAKRLDNELAFRGELAKAVFGQSMDLLEKELGMQNLLDSTDRQFREGLSNMNIDHATRMADIELDKAAKLGGMSMDDLRLRYKQQAKAAAIKNNAVGISKIAEGGAAAYGSYANSPAESSIADSGGGSDVESARARPQAYSQGPAKTTGGPS